MDTPWFQDGLRFTCTRCGNCCTGAPGFVWVSAAEIECLAEKQGVTADEFVKMYTRTVGDRVTLRDDSDGNCIFYKSKTGCTVYDVRPVQCRTWPFWKSTAGTPEAWKRTQQNCPGAGHGDLFPAEEITRRMSLFVI